MLHSDSVSDSLIIIFNAFESCGHKFVGMQIRDNHARLHESCTTARVDDGGDHEWPQFRK